MSLEQLAVVSAPQVTFDSKHPDRVMVEFTPTVPHCGMSTFIGLCTVMSTAHSPAYIQAALRSLHPRTAAA
jgi:hypothetical protein